VRRDVVMALRRGAWYAGALATACVVTTRQDRLVRLAKGGDWRRHGDDDSTSVASIKQVRGQQTGGPGEAAATGAHGDGAGLQWTLRERGKWN